MPEGFDAGDTRDKLAKKVGLSGRTLEKARFRRCYIGTA
jgi:hypothetical protein